MPPVERRIGWDMLVKIFAPVGIPAIVTRPAQTGSKNNNQDLLSDNASTYSYSHPVGDALTTSDTPLALPLTAGNQYTEDFLIALTGANTYTITSNLYAGNADTGTPIAAASGSNTAPADFLTSSFDGMAFGWRYSSSITSTPEMDINSVTVSVMPEPATVGVLGFAGVALLARRRRGSGI